MGYSKLSNQKDRKRDEKMEIKITKLPTEQFMDAPLLQHADNQITISEYIKENKTLTQFHITLESQDIRNLMKWQMGQEEYHENQRKHEENHKQESIQSNKDQDNQKIIDEIRNYLEHGLDRNADAYDRDEWRKVYFAIAPIFKKITGKFISKD